jgi:oligopeptide/dipeptide ABC transporter ATP-binding protein
LSRSNILAPINDVAGVTLSVRGLCVSFQMGGERVPALEDVSFDLRPGEVLALVGESGAGKSLTALAVMGLLPVRARVDRGAVLLENRDLARLPAREMTRLRGDRMSMIFQEPMTSLNPVLTIGRQLTEGLEFHLGLAPEAAAARAGELLRQVGIPAAERRLREYPHQLSGGMRQRVMIAMAIACDPRLIIADEPTTALDVSIQAQIIDLLVDIRGRLKTAILLITHDLGVVSEMADRVAVLYSGRIVEVAEAEALFDAPQHPYTQGLLEAVPRLDLLAQDDGSRTRLREIAGVVPSLRDRPAGCQFWPRCPLAKEWCRQAVPPLAPMPDGRTVACWVRQEEVA